MNPKDKKRAEKKKEAKKRQQAARRRAEAPEPTETVPLGTVVTRKLGKMAAAPKEEVLPKADELPTREELAGVPGMTPMMQELIDAIRTGKYDPQKHLEEILNRQKERAAFREREIEMYDSVKDTPPADWKGKDTPFTSPVMWLKGSTWENYNLFPELPTMPHDGTMSHDEFKEHTVRVPGTQFYYSNKTLPLSYSLDTALTRKDRSRAFFDTPIVCPVLFEQTGEDEDYRQKVWMGLTPMEMLTQKKGIDMARGRVVVGGLGLGWFLKEIAAKPEVREIVVVDKVPELIEFIRPVLEAKYPDVARKVKEWLPGDVYQYMIWDLKMRGYGTPAYALKEALEPTMYLLDIWPNLGDCDYDRNFVMFETELGRDKVWGWGRGATHGGEVPQLDAHKKLPYERAYMRKNSCTGCPFSRTGRPWDDDKEGNTDPMRLIVQAHGPFILPCHQEEDYNAEKQGEVYKMAQCAGAAKFRANLGLKLPECLHELPPDPERAFTSPAEMLAHYNSISVEEAQKILDEVPMEDRLQAELNAQKVRVYASSRPEGY